MEEVKECWDKTFTQKLIKLGLSFNQAREITAIVVEERMRADLQGYDRGYNNGYETAKKYKTFNQ